MQQEDSTPGYQPAPGPEAPEPGREGLDPGRADDTALVVQTEPLHPEAAAWLAERCRLVRHDPAEPGFEALLDRADGLVIRTYTRVDEALLSRAPRLRVVGRAGVGLDNVDLDACARRGIRVVHTPDANTQAVVEFVFAILFDAIRPRRVLDSAVDAATWRALRAGLSAPRQLADLVVGVWGFGRIGSRVARAAAAFDARVLYHDLLDIPADRRSGAEPVPREELLERADVLTLHVDGRASNRGMLGAAELARMRDDAILINAARGFIVDTEALAEWLRAHPAAKALLDVHEREPFPSDSPLLALPNARLTPHIAAATEPANRAMSMVVQDVWHALRETRAPDRSQPR
jgi:phosphoglycerate dehydrogenase-like enzyme